MEHFLRAARVLGLPEGRVFKAPDVVERRDMAKVITALASLAEIASFAPWYSGPKFASSPTATATATTTAKPTAVPTATTPTAAVQPAQVQAPMPVPATTPSKAPSAHEDRRAKRRSVRDVWSGAHAKSKSTVTPAMAFAAQQQQQQLHMPPQPSNPPPQPKVVVAAQSQQQPTSGGEAKKTIMWANGVLKRCAPGSPGAGRQITDARKDFVDGTVLAAIAETLTGQPVGRWYPQPGLPWHADRNLETVFGFLTERAGCRVPPGFATAAGIAGGSIEQAVAVLNTMRARLDPETLTATVPEESRWARVFAELLASERTYVRTLVGVWEELMRPMILAAARGAPVLAAQELSEVFTSIDVVALHHASLLMRLEDRTRETSAAQRGRITDLMFVRLAEWFEAVYADYARTFATSVRAVHRLRANNVAFASQVLAWEELYRADLSRCLAAPLHRPAQYLTLITELAKHTSQSSDEQAAFIKAKELFGRVSAVADAARLEVESFRKAIAFEAASYGLAGSVDSAVLRDGLLEIADAEMNASTYFVLLPERLLLCKHKPSAAKHPGKSFKIAESFAIASFEEVIPNNGFSGQVFSHGLEIVTSEFSLVLLAQTEADRDGWIASIKQAMQQS